MTPGRALIIGAGIGGPIIGLWLKQLGWQVTLLEARPTLATAEGAFLGLAPNGLQALHPLGLSAAVAAIARPCHRFEFVNAAGRSLGSIDRADDARAFGFPLSMVRRAELHAVLAQVAAARGLEVQLGRALSAVTQDADSVRATLDDGTTLDADLLIGADGARSMTRRLVLPEAPVPRPLGLLDAGGFGAGVSLPFEPGVNAMVFGQKAFFGVFETASREQWWFHNGPLPAQPLQADALRTRLLELHRFDPPWVNALITATPTLVGPWSVTELASLSRWWKGRVCLLGDAAHVMSPSAGQGASMAFEDALVLSQCLRDAPTPEAAFFAYQRARQPRVDAIASAARRSSSQKALSPLQAWFRDRMLPWVLPAAGRAQTKAYAQRFEWSLPAPLA